jgi:hypothetical protein
MAHPSAAAGPSVGSLLFEIISASNLPAVDEGSADPYVVITGSDGLVLSGFDMYSQRMMTLKQDKGKYENFGVRAINRTNYMLRSLNPVWNCKIELGATGTDGCIVLAVWDYNNFSKNKTMGSARLPMTSVVGEHAKINHELQLSNGGSLLVKVNWVPADTKSENPLEDIATQASGSFQFKVFTSTAGRSPVTDLINCNTQARDWLNSVRELIHFIKIDNENDDKMASAVVWYRVK